MARGLSRVVLVTLGLIGLIWGVVYAASFRPRMPPAACGPGLTVMSANLLMVNPDPSALAQEILEVDADVLMLQELSPRWVSALEEAGVWARWPYGEAIAREDSFGSALRFKQPPPSASIFELDGLPQTRGSVKIGTGELEIWNIHVLPPRTVAYWRAYRFEVGLLEEAAREQTGPFLMGGDFNSHGLSAFVRQMRGVMDDAWDLAGSGPGHTWPNGVFTLPPLRLDHLYLSRDLTVTGIRIGVGANSDHRPLIATIAPRAGGRLCSDGPPEESP